MKLMENHIIAGTCKLVEVSPEHFEAIIEWRNDEENRKYLNQTFVATMETQRKWFEKYQNDASQILYIMEDGDGVPFGTIGLKQIDLRKKTAEVGSLIVKYEYRGSIEMAECLLSFYKTAFNYLDALYGSIVKDNHKVLKLNSGFGFTEAKGKFPKQECQNNRFDLVDVCVTKDSFYNSKLFNNLKERL